MSEQHSYKCTDCGKMTPRDKLLTKKVSFSTLGSDGKMIKSRTVGWLCFPCVKKDPTYNIPEYDSPGLRQDEAIREQYMPNEAAGTVTEGEA